MANRHNTTREFLVAALLALFIAPDAIVAQAAELKQVIGGITFDPPRSARIRLASGQYIRGELMAVSRELVQFRLKSGKIVQYDFKHVRFLSTIDGAVKYTSAHDSYKDVVKEAEGLAGVTIDARAAAVASGQPIELPRPPAPQIPVMLDSPDNYDRPSLAAAPSHRAANQPKAVPPIPPATALVAQAGTIEPFYETGVFKIGFLVACLAVVGLWWRNKIG